MVGNAWERDAPGDFTGGGPVKEELPRRWCEEEGLETEVEEEEEEEEEAVALGVKDARSTDWGAQRVLDRPERKKSGFRVGLRLLSFRARTQGGPEETCSCWSQGGRLDARG